MPITVRCSCGKELHARDDMAGKSGKCPTCGEILTFEVHTGQTRVIAKKNNPFDFSMPSAKKAEPAVLKVASATPPPPPANAQYMFERPKAPPPSPLAPVALPGESSTPKPAPPIFKPSKKKQGNVLLELRHLLLGVALIPLGMALFTPHDDINKRREETESHLTKDAKKRLDALQHNPDATLEDYFEILPDNKLEGAYLSKGTLNHWIYAVISATIFLGIIVFLFPKGDAAASELFLAGVFTGVVGIMLLLAVQWIAFSSGFRFYGGGKAIIVFIILKFIAFSYRAALDPSYGFLTSLFGFTFGVGLMEELTKALPVFWRSEKLGWRECCVWGLASGVGFGVSEGVSYSSSFYNGITGSDIYVIRFVSCVALHAVWSAAVGIAIFRSKAAMKQEGNAAIEVLKVLIVPMFLHGLYDTFLKKDMPGAAFLTALFSFGWLAFQIERAMSEEERGEPVVA